MFGAAELSDEVVRGAAGGSRNDFTHVARAMEPQIRLMVVARLSPTPAQFDAIDEIVQQVMVALTEGISRLENRSVGGLKTYSSRIVSHKVADFINHRREGKLTLGIASLDSVVDALSGAGPLWQVLSSGGKSPPSAAVRAEQTSRLMAELGRLKPEHREVITQTFFDQLPVREIAEQMGTSRAAVSMLLIRAVQTLRRNLLGSRDLS